MLLQVHLMEQAGRLERLSHLRSSQSIGSFPDEVARVSPEAMVCALMSASGHLRPSEIGLSKYAFTWSADQIGQLANDRDGPAADAGDFNSLLWQRKQDSPTTHSLREC